MEPQLREKLQLSDNPIRIGITGGMAAGKSEAARFFLRRGFPVFFADAVAKELLISNVAIRQAISRRWGPGVFLQPDEVDKQKIASLIFGDVAERRWLEGLIHPEVWLAFTVFCTEQPAGTKLIFHEAALLFQAGFDKKLDLVIFIEASLRVRTERAMQRSNLTHTEIVSRIEAQGNLDELARRSDYRIENNSTIFHLEQQLEGILNHIETHRHLGFKG